MMIKGDYIGEVDFYKLLDFHYINNSSLTLTVEEVPPKPKSKDVKLKAFQTDMFTEKFTYMLEEKSNRLIGSIDPYDLIETGIKVKTSVLARHPNIYFNSNLIQKGITICNLGICKILKELGDHFGSFSEEFITFLAHNQYNSKLHQILTEEGTASPSQTVQRYYKKVHSRSADFFRPFVYLTSEFSIRIKSVFDFHQANLLRVAKGKEISIMERTKNDEEETPIILIKNEEKEPVDKANDATKEKVSEKPKQNPEESLLESSKVNEKPTQDAQPTNVKKPHESQNSASVQEGSQKQPKKEKKPQEGQKGGQGQEAAQNQPKKEKKPQEGQKGGQGQEAVQNQPKKDNPKDKKAAEKKATPAKLMIDNNFSGDNVCVNEASTVMRCIIGNNVIVGNGCKLVNCVIFSGAHIADKYVRVYIDAN
jgi:hypothetical protein